MTVRRAVSRRRIVRMVRRLTARTRNDDGSGSLEFIIVVPVVLTVLFLAIQISILSYTRSVAMTAAEEGLDAERGFAGAGTGQGRAAEFVARQGDWLTGTQVTVSRTGEQVSVTVTGQSLSLVPGFSGWTVSQTATGPVERYTEP
jgi:hypothetical protein